MLRALAILAMAHALVAPPSQRRNTAQRAIKIVDHVNMNHEQGRHDLLKAFYFDLLGFAVDPRKIENLDKGKKTLWANAGIAQLHLPEGKPEAQPLDGRLTLAYADLDRFDDARLSAAHEALEGTKFQMRASADGFDVSCPWGTPMTIKIDGEAADPRGVQDGEASAPLHMTDIALHVSRGADLAGVQRFYTRIMGVPEGDCTLVADQLLQLKIGPAQTLSFVSKPFGKANHAELGEDDEGRSRRGNQPVNRFSRRVDGVENMIPTQVGRRTAASTSPCMLMIWERSTTGPTRSASLS